MPASISSAFDSGNIRVLSQDGPADFTLAINRDAGGEFFQWFHFRLSGARGVPATLRLTGLAASAYPDGWPGYRARVSADRIRWATADTAWDKAADGGTLTIRLTPASDHVWLAYFAPYSFERHQDLIARMSLAPGVSSRVLGVSLDGRPIDCLDMGEGSLPIWLYARQHPGETMAEWWMEGALEALTDPAFAAGRILRQRARLHLVPNMNPDGSVRGYLRTNAAGANLNREWAAPTAARAPEVLAILAAMEATGVAFALDVHGDESLPHNFIAGFEGVPSLRPGQAERLEHYKALLAARTPEFQTKVGYPPAARGKANLAMSTNQLAERFGAISATLEMPFKDCDDAAFPETGWSPDRAKALARACLEALADFLPHLPA
jgi:murein tripeptide amidase MpaA